MLLKTWLQKISRFDEPDFQASQEATRKFALIVGYCFLAFVNPIYILIDRSMFPDAWYHWNFLGVRAMASLLALLALVIKPCRESMAFFLIPFSILQCGITLMLITYPLDRWTEAYQGAALIVVGMTLISSLSWIRHFLYLLLLYCFTYSIWILNPPPSMEVWLTDGGFSNLNTTFVIALAFHYLRLSYAYANFQLTKEIVAKNQELEVRSRDVHSILKNIPEGVCIITLDAAGQGLELDPYTSDFLQKLIQTGDDHGRDPFSLIFQHTDLSTSTQASIRWIILTALKDDILQWELNQHALPRQFRLHRQQKVHVIEAEWNAIADKERVVQKILVTLKDVTDLRQWQMKAHKRQQEAQRILELLNTDARKLDDFFPAAEHFLDGAQKGLDGTSSALQMTASLRNLHTLKGMARTYQLDELVEKVHEAEERLLQFKAQAATADEAGQDIRACQETLEDYRQCFQKIQPPDKGGSRVTIDKKEARRLLGDLQKALQEGAMERAAAAVASLNHLFSDSFENLIEDEIHAMKELARRLGKPHPLVQVEACSIPLDDSVRSALRNAFLHLFRNSLDHGIESEAERLQKGKPAHGIIRIGLRREGGVLTIRYSDDGRGLNLPAILRRARDLKLIGGDDQPSAVAIAEFIFHPGLSTSEKTTETSGRGIGMDCVRSFLEEQGCRLRLELSGDTAVTTVIDVPLRRLS